MMKILKKYGLLAVILLGAAFLQFYGNNDLVLGSDELYRARSLVGDDWSLTSFPWPEDATREQFNNWPMHTPPLFGYLSRVAVVIFKDVHFSLRFWPFLFAVLATVLSYFVYRKFYGRSYALLAPLLLGIASDEMLVNAKSLKHYTADILLGFMMLYSAKNILAKNKTSDWFVFTLCSAVGIWLAFGSVFIAASVYLVLLFSLLQRYSIKGIFKIQHSGKLLASGLITAASFLLLYFINMRQAYSNPTFLEHISASGMQFFEWSRIADVRYVFHFLARIGFQTFKLAYFFFEDSYLLAVILNGFVVVWFLSRFRERNWTELSLLFLPVGFAIISAFAGKYPYTANRLLLFLLPMWVMMIAFGIEKSTRFIKAKNAFAGKAWLVLVLVILSVGMASNVNKVMHKKFAGGRRVDATVQKLLEQAKDGDTVYLHWGAILPFYIYGTDHRAGYQHEYPLPDSRGAIHVIYGEEHLLNLANYEKDMQKVVSVPGRVWVMFCHRWPDEDMLLLKKRMAEKRKLVDEFNFKGCQLLLYDTMVESPVLMSSN
jgi:hypothetical protein